MEKLTEDEMNQLRTLLVRYFAYHAQGVFNMAVDALLARVKSSSSMIDVTPMPELSNPDQSPNGKRRQTRGANAR
jgi:hypothetical protein